MQSVVNVNKNVLCKETVVEITLCQVILESRSSFNPSDVNSFDYKKQNNLLYWFLLAYINKIKWQSILIYIILWFSKVDQLLTGLTDYISIWDHGLNWPLPLVSWSLLSQWLPGLPLQDSAREHQLILSLDDHLLYLTHPDLLFRLLDGVALLQYGNPLIDDGLRVLPVGIVYRHLGKSPQVFTTKKIVAKTKLVLNVEPVENTQSVSGIFGHRHSSESCHHLGIWGHIWSEIFSLNIC